MKRPLFLFLLSITLLAGAGSGFLVFLGWEFTQTSVSSNSEEVIYEVTPGKSFSQVTADLAQSRIVKNAWAFSIYARIKNQRGKLKAGEYLLNRNMKPDDVLAVITSGKSIARPFTISEGLNIFDIAALIEQAKIATAAEFLSLVKDPAFIKDSLGSLFADDQLPPTLEGYLYPETYQVTKFTKLDELVGAMVRGFIQVYSSIKKESYPSNLTDSEVVTLASIVEKETGAPEERPMISSVFHNRFKKKMKMQTDPTIIYGIAMETGKVPENITRADILRPTKYNTYVISGLPPGPIANPGKEALMAAMSPAQSEALFFVSQNNGTHVFSATLEQHNNSVKKFQLNPAERAGKSWRDLKKPQK